jgi:acyl carrier protein
MNNEIRQQLISHLHTKLERFGIGEGELTTGFDLVKSGLVNSLEFVELVTGLEKHFGIEVDFEAALDAGDFTTFGGLANTLEKYLNG